MAAARGSRLTAADRRVLQQALNDALGWQEGLIGSYAHMPDAPERKEARDQAARYRALLRKLTGSAATQEEKSLEGATYVTLAQLRTGHGHGHGR